MLWGGSWIYFPPKRRCDGGEVGVVNFASPPLWGGKEIGDFCTSPPRGWPVGGKLNIFQKTSPPSPRGGSAFYAQGKGGPQGFCVEDVWPTSIWRGSWFSIFKKLNIFVFTLCIWTHLWKILIFGSYILRKTFFIFSSKKLDVVTITRYQITFWIFDFSLFDILPKYMNPKIVSRSLYALHADTADGRGRTRTPDGRIDF